MRDDAHWIGTWTAAPAPAEGAAFSNHTLRMIPRVSIGGSTLRVRISNAYGVRPLALGAVCVGVRSSGPGIVPGSNRRLTFGGETSATIAAGALVVSDPVELPFPPLSGPAHDRDDQDLRVARAGRGGHPARRGGIGGAMDLLSGKAELIIVMEHMDSRGRPTLRWTCAYPVTGRACVSPWMRGGTLPRRRGAAVARRRLPRPPPATRLGRRPSGREQIHCPGPISRVDTSGWMPAADITSGRYSS